MYIGTSEWVSPNQSRERKRPVHALTVATRSATKNGMNVTAKRRLNSGIVATEILQM